ncbi:MAG: hypothetical protein OXC98_07850 [bacterium]|nr:hypothetical protein [Acidimicrobiia bacterium]MCY4650268.1 hypothetical protein [bacterium]
MSRMSRQVAALLLGLLLVSCGGGDSEEADAIASRTPRGTEEAQAALDRFLDNPFITEEQAEQSKDMVWRACAAMQDGVGYQEFEAQELAVLEEGGRILTDLELGGMRTGASLGISAYCPQHEDQSP